MAQRLKCLPAVQETWVRSLGREDPLEKEMATHSSTLLLGKFHGWRSLVGYSLWSCKESDMIVRLHFHFSHLTHVSIRITLFMLKKNEVEEIEKWPE